jgi:serine/threonine protein kinase
MVGIATTFYSTSMTEILSQRISITAKMDLCKQLINIMRQIHSVFVIHCDVKPDNFMCYNDGLLKLVIIDFGMSRLFVDSQQTTKHLPNKISDSLFGTPKYASYNVHLGHKYSRRDDLISIGYLLMTVFDIALPWSLSVIQNDDQSQRLLTHCDHPHNLYRRDLKMYDNLVEYLRKTDFADILIPYFTEVYSLNYDEAPTYSSLVNYFIIP